MSNQATNLVSIDHRSRKVTMFPKTISEVRFTPSSDPIIVRADDLFEVCKAAEAGQDCDINAVSLGNAAFQLVIDEASKQARALRKTDKSIPRTSATDHAEIAQLFVRTYKKGVSDAARWQRVIRKWLKTR